ncbi:MAG: hypothetical protein ACI4GO_03130 [Hominenteromicrobium sp.]
MNRIVLLMESERAAVLETASWFAAHGDRVYLGVRVLPKQVPEGVRCLVFDPLCAESLEKAVKTVEAEAGRLDIFVAGVPDHPKDGEIGTGHDEAEMLETLMRSIYGSRTAIEAFLPLLRRGMKRIAAITEIESSNSWSTGREDLAYHTALAGMNMMGKILFNRLRPEGFTFRWYCDGAAPGGMCAGGYITSGLCYDEKEPYIHSDENRLTLRDAYLREISW